MPITILTVPFCATCCDPCALGDTIDAVVSVPTACVCRTFGTVPLWRAIKIIDFPVTWSLVKDVGFPSWRLTDGEVEFWSSEIDCASLAYVATAPIDFLVECDPGTGLLTAHITATNGSFAPNTIDLILLLSGPVTLDVFAPNEDDCNVNPALSGWTEDGGITLSLP